MSAPVFDVPGNLTLRDVSRPAPNETPDQRIERLAKKAIIEGIRILTEPKSGLQFATSSHDASVLYRLNLSSRSCSCAGYERAHICKHICLAMMQSGLARTEPKTCSDCNGRRGHERQCGGRLSDWIWVQCRDCKGTGVVR